MSLINTDLNYVHTVQSTTGTKLIVSFQSEDRVELLN